ncbi:MAG: lysophospholipid acyltransferase family protein [Proteobacteria bacterium]|nr:lysophospholipid acyltransferase family protein [Pseudomonadota bacterium]
MALKINEILSSKFAQWLLYKFIRTYSLTYRLEVQNETSWLDDYLHNNGSILLCVHHQQFFPAIRYFQRYKKFKPGLMISQSRDGDFISGVANRTGWTTVRGSSTRGGQEALKGMIDHLAAHRLAGHIIDGPRGPSGGVKPGAIRLAHATNSVIVPFYAWSDRAWHARSWDKFLLPKPFSRVVLRFGEKIIFKQTETSEDFEEQRKTLEDIMFKGNEQLKADLAQ